MRVEILDHGYVELIEMWGSEERIIEAARMSTGRGFKGWGTRTLCKLCGRYKSEATGDKVAEYDSTRCPNHDWETVVCGPGAADRWGQSITPDTVGDERLLKYLYTHKHMTPFEMAGMTIEVQAPIFVFREWHRHRTQCLAGDTDITLVTPNGTTFKRTVKEIFDLKHGGSVDTAPKRHRNGTSKAGTPVTREARRKDPWRVRRLPNCQDRVLRVLDEGTHTFTTAKMARVWESGVKLLFEITTEDGRRVKASEDHPFLTTRGWVKLRELSSSDYVARMGVVAAQERPIPSSLRSGIGVWTTMMRKRLLPLETGQCYICGETYPSVELAIDHVVPVCENLKLALDEDNLRPACATCHREKTNTEQADRKAQSRRGARWTKVVNVRNTNSREMTYDIEVEGPHHNYLANDLVVHNSYNEMSARYTPLPDVNYVPSVERLTVGSGTNKQAQGLDGRVLSTDYAETWRQILVAQYENQESVYQHALDVGVPKELARIVLPVGRYSRMMASTDLRNWLQFLTLRCDEHAQWEIRQYANVVADMLASRFPRTVELWKVEQQG